MAEIGVAMNGKSIQNLRYEAQHNVWVVMYENIIKPSC